MAIFYEKQIHPIWGILVLFAAALGICFPYFIEAKELISRESIYGIMATEITWSSPWCTIYGELAEGQYPLYPLLVKTLMNLGYSPEFSLRIINVTALLIIASLAYNVSLQASKNYLSAGVSAAVVLTSFSVIDRAMLGCPDFVAVGFIFSAWMILFSIGLANNKWASAWTFATPLILLSFFTLGWTAITLFFIPLLFQARPFSGFAKLRRTEAICAFLIMGIVIFIWYYCTPDLRMIEQPSFFESKKFPYGIIHDLFVTPIDLFIRFLPWSILLYTAFCAAYRPLDENPFFSRYLRTLFLTSLGLIIFLPFFDLANEGKMLIPILGLLVSIHYSTFVRRNGFVIDKTLRLLNYIVSFGCLCMLGFYFTLIYWDKLSSFATKHDLFGIIILFNWIQENWLTFNDLQAFKYNNIFLTSVAIGLILIYFFILRKRTPLWVHIVWFMLTLTIIHWSFVIPRRMIVQPKRVLAQKIAESFLHLDDSPLTGRTLYKTPSSSSLYAEMTYTGFNVKTLRSIRTLPPEVDSTFFLLTDDIPAPLPNFKWNETECFKATIGKSTFYIWQGFKLDETHIQETQPSSEHSSLLP